MEIKYEVDFDATCLTECKHRKVDGKSVMVGSLICENECQHFFDINTQTQTVICKAADQKQQV